MKKVMTAALLVLALLVGAFAPARAEAATKKEKAYAAYYEAIEYIRNPESPAGGFEKFKLIYVNSDSIPELLAVHVPKDEYENNGIVDYALFTYYKGEVVSLGGFSSGVASAGGYRGSTSYIKKSGLVYETSIYSGTGEGVDTVYRMKGRKLSKKAQGKFNISGENMEWAGKSVSEKTYNKKLNKVYDTKKAVDFESIKFISYKAMRKKLGN